MNRTAAQAADEIESISEDLRREIEDFRYRDRWAALGLTAAAAGAITGVGGVIFAVRKLKRTVGVGASVIAGNQAYEETDGVVDPLSFVFPALQKIERGIDISGARRRNRQATTTLQGLKSDMLKWERLYNQNQCSIVTETFGRGY